MAVNLKNITDLPVVESAEGLNLIVNDNGAAKQIAASAVGMQADFNVTDETSPAFIKNKPEIVQADWAETDESSAAFVRNKPRRELMYEWNFEADENPDNCVWEMYENVDDDISWLTSPQDDCNWEIELSQYGRYEIWNEEYEQWEPQIHPEVYTTLIINKNCGYLRFQNESHIFGEIFVSYPQDYLNDWELGYSDNVCMINAYNKVHYDYNFIPSMVSEGGHFNWFHEGGGPLKSIKIYKITK